MARDEIDGVATFWVDSGRPTLTASLMFRWGSGDEPATESGWQHLLEHLALHERMGGGQLQINGEVSLQHTSFDAHGPADEVAAHLSGVAQWLSEPSFARMDTERRVLAAEAAQRSSVGLPNALGMRYGAAGPGIVAFGELGLGRATPELLAARARAVFTQQNAVLMLDGPPPPGWRLPLPSGRLRVPQPVHAVEELPAGYVDAGLLASGVVRRTPAATLLPETLRREFVDEFRERLGLAYSPFCGYEYADADHAVAYVGTDINGAERGCATTARDLLQTHAERGPDEVVVSEIKAMIIQGLRDPYATYGLALRAGGMHLAGEDPHLTLDQVVAEYESITADDVRIHAAELLDSLLLAMPPLADEQQMIRMVTQPTTTPRVPPTQGRKHANWPACLDRLIVDGHGTVLASGDQALDYPHADLAAYLTYPSGIRHLVRADGWGLTIDPAQWSGGSGVVASLDAAVPGDLHTPQREREGRESFNRASLGGRYRPLLALNTRKDPVVKSDPTARLIAQGSDLLFVLVLLTLVFGMLLLTRLVDTTPDYPRVEIPDKVTVPIGMGALRDVLSGE
ncbi:MAG TPA: hypothetical protein VNJ48_14930 [Nocardioides sp.]|nr:hypothetical protein [Nocardioides sp.]